MTIICKHAFISGVVQGVWFRANTQKEARSLGVTGWVRNLADGRVEVMMTGDENAVLDLEKWLHHGPNGARVDDVQIDTLTQFQLFESFDVV